MSYFESDKNYSVHLINKKTQLISQNQGQQNQISLNQTPQNQAAFSTDQQYLMEKISRNLKELQRTNKSIKNHSQLNICKEVAQLIQKEIKQLESSKIGDQNQMEDKKIFLKKIKSDFQSEIHKLDKNAQDIQNQLKNQQDHQSKNSKVQEYELEQKQNKEEDQDSSDQTPSINERLQSEKLSFVDLKFQEDMLQEREVEIKKIEKDIVEINEMMKDTSQLVKEQGEHLQLIEDFVDNAEANTSDANIELFKAQNIQKKSKRKMQEITFR